MVLLTLPVELFEEVSDSEDKEQLLEFEQRSSKGHMDMIDLCTGRQTDVKR